VSQTAPHLIYCSISGESGQLHILFIAQSHVSQAAPHLIYCSISGESGSSTSCLLLNLRWVRQLHILFIAQSQVSQTAPHFIYCSITGESDCSTFYLLLKHGRVCRRELRILFIAQSQVSKTAPYLILMGNTVIYIDVCGQCPHNLCCQIQTDDNSSTYAFKTGKSVLLMDHL
jgi:hypothetical protein